MKHIVEKVKKLFRKRAPLPLLLKFLLQLHVSQYALTASHEPPVTPASPSPSTTRSAALSWSSEAEQTACSAPCSS